MRVLLVLAACFAFASAATLRFDSSDRLSEQWQLFKTTYKKSYESEFHEKLRRTIFEENLRYIQRHNIEADLGRHTYRLGMNQYGDLTNAEFRRLMLGLRLNTSQTSSGAATFLPPSNVHLPDTVDWRTKGCVTPVKNQGQCGASWAFSATGSLEGQHFMRTGKLVSLSEQNLVDCMRDGGCEFGSSAMAFVYIAVNNGIDTEASYPYTAKKGGCQFKKQDVGATDVGFTVIISKGNETLIKIATAFVGPISVAIDASHRSFQLYKSGVYNEPNCSSWRPDQAVLIVGYGTDNGDDYWLVKNSWGASWGLQGYIKMSRNKNNQCGIATQASFPLV